MKKTILSLNIVIIITLTVICYAAYSLLLQDNFLHSSISAIISMSHQLDPKRHLIVLGLLPIYIATVIFGAALLGLYIGSFVQEYLMGDIKKPIIAQKKVFGDIAHSHCKILTINRIRQSPQNVRNNICN
jgi:hypothetical protein